MMILGFLAMALCAAVASIIIEPSAARYAVKLGRRWLLKLEGHAEGRDRARVAYTEGYKSVVGVANRVDMMTLPGRRG